MSLIMMSDAAVASGQAFLVGELEKQKAEINMPLSDFTWQRDMPFDMGGGAVENISNLFADFASSGSNHNGIVGPATNVIPNMQANFSKDLTPVFPWMNNLQIKFLDLQKIQNTGRSLEPILKEGIQLNWNKTLDECVYTGFTTYGQTGLINNASVTVASVANTIINPNSVSGAALTKWINKTPGEILNDWNTFFTAQWATAQYSRSDMMNHFLIPATSYGYLATTPVSALASKSILTYLMENNIANKELGIDLKVVPCRQCIGAGASGVDRMVGYVHRKDRLTFDITVPLVKGLTEASVQQASYFTNYFGFVSAVQIKYFQTIRYADGI